MTTETMTAVRRKLPGKPKSAAEALVKWDEERRKMVHNGAYPPIVAALICDIHFGAREDLHRWRIRLDCGHIREVMTRGEDQLPLGPWQDPDYTGVPGRRVFTTLPDGHAPCGEFECWYRNRPYRDITEWKTREVTTFPADPEEVPDYWRDRGDEGRETWAKVRHAEPHSIAVWEVVLSCGHITTTQAEVEWKPEDGIRYRIDPADEAAMARRAEILASDIGEDTKRDFERMLPYPTPDEQCGACARDRMITAYELTGPLVPPLPKPRKAPDPREALQRRLAEAERAARRLRAELDALDREG